MPGGFVHPIMNPRFSWGRLAAARHTSTGFTRFNGGAAADSPQLSILVGRLEELFACHHPPKIRASIPGLKGPLEHGLAVSGRDCVAGAGGWFYLAGLQPAIVPPGVNIK